MKTITEGMLIFTIYLVALGAFGFGFLAMFDTLGMVPKEHILAMVVVISTLFTIRWHFISK